MSLHHPKTEKINGAPFRFCLVAARYNPTLVDALLKRTRNTLSEFEVQDANVTVTRVPGSNELPYLAHLQAIPGQYDCIIALGVVIAGKTDHHRIIAESTARAFHEIGIKTQVPVINGIITASTTEQAAARTTGELNRGAEFAQAALEMAQHKNSFYTSLK